MNEYADLKRLVKDAGLLNKQPMYYAFKLFFTFGILALALALLVMLDNLWPRLLIAAFLAFIFGQIAFIGHDAGHKQISRSNWNNDIFGLFCSLLICIERSWWVDKHNRHHSKPNQVDSDPDINIPVIAFTKEQALDSRGIFRFIVRHQSFLFFPMLCLEGLSLRFAGVQYLFHNKAKYPRIEPLLIAVHGMAYVAGLFFLLGLWEGILFMIVHQALFGLYMGSVFAPNHKGMLIVEKDSKMDFLQQQVLTSRNVKAHPLTDFLYGGLNYQIEHHLFANMPRNNLKKAQIIVKAFCLDRSIPYYETTVLGSNVEILQYLHEISISLEPS